MNHLAPFPLLACDRLARVLRLLLGAWLLRELPDLISADADPRSLCVQALVGLALLGIEVPWGQLLARAVGRQ